MAFYELDKSSRDKLVDEIYGQMSLALHSAGYTIAEKYFSDEDTYIRKTAYNSIGKICKAEQQINSRAVRFLNELWKSDNFRVRQTVINAAGEIGKRDFDIVAHLFSAGLFDVHHSVRNAVIGSVKKMAEVNPSPVLAWAEKYLDHPDQEIRREICHGIELRGRKFPGDILPLLARLQFDKTRRVRDTLIHVLGQISYKKGCLPVVIADLKTWENQQLVAAALEEIVDVHHRYRDFAALTREEAKLFISQEFAALK